MITLPDRWQRAAARWCPGDGAARPQRIIKVVSGNWWKKEKASSSSELINKDSHSLAGE